MSTQVAFDMSFDQDRETYIGLDISRFVNDLKLELVKGKLSLEEYTIELQTLVYLSKDLLFKVQQSHTLQSVQVPVESGT